MSYIKRNLIIILCILMISSLFSTAFAAEASSKSIKLVEYEGSLVVKKGDKELSKITKGMRIFDGYNISTKKESYAYLELDDSKFVKIDQLSDVKFKKNGKKNDILLNSGALFFNVKKPLEDNESLNVKTSTMTMGVRGTSGSVVYNPMYNDDNKIIGYNCNVQIYTGLGSITMKNNNTNETTIISVKPGFEVNITIDSATGNITTTESELNKNGSEIPGVAASEIIKDEELINKIKSLTGIELSIDTVNDIQSQENSEASKIVQAAENEKKDIKNSKDNIIYDGNNNDSISNGIITDNNDDNNNPPIDTPKDTPITDEESLLSALNDPDKTSINITSGAAIVINSSIVIPNNKILTLDEGSTLEINGNLSVIGTLVNNSNTTLKLNANSSIVLESNSSFINNGVIDDANGIGVKINGSNINIQNNVNKTIPRLNIATMEKLIIANNGNINLINGIPGSTIEFTGANNTSVEANGSQINSGIMYYDYLDNELSEIEYDKTYIFDGRSIWKEMLPDNVAIVADEAELTAALNNESITSIYFRPKEETASIEDTHTISSGKTLVILVDTNIGTSGKLILNGGEIINSQGATLILSNTDSISLENNSELTNNGVISNLADTDSTPGITTNGAGIHIINGTGAEIAYIYNEGTSTVSITNSGVISLLQGITDSKIIFNETTVSSVSENGGQKNNMGYAEFCDFLNKIQDEISYDSVYTNNGKNTWIQEIPHYVSIVTSEDNLRTALATSDITDIYLQADISLEVQSFVITNELTIPTGKKVINYTYVTSNANLNISGGTLINEVNYSIEMNNGSSIILNANSTLTNYGIINSTDEVYSNLVEIKSISASIDNLDKGSEAIISLLYINISDNTNNEAFLISNNGFINNLTGIQGSRIKFSELSTTEISCYGAKFVDSNDNPINEITKGAVYTYNGQLWIESELTQ